MTATNYIDDLLIDLKSRKFFLGQEFVNHFVKEVEKKESLKQHIRESI
jgi:hypothetical protein